VTTEPPKINLTLDPAKQTLDLSNVIITATANPASIGLGNDGRQIIKDYIITPPYEGSYEVTPTKSTQILATDGLKMTDDVTVNPIPDEYIVPTGSQTIVANDTYDITDKAEVVVAVPDPVMQSKSVSFTPSESTQSSTVTPSAGYDGLDSVDISVDAVSDTYVGSAIDRRDSSDLTASGDTVSVPSGFYENAASKAVAGGTEGTPTATKGTVSNHSVSVTPSVTNTAGYITGSTKTGTPVTVSASELVSGTKSITSNGTGIDVTEYAAVDVAVPGSSPTLQTKSKTYTPTESAQSDAFTADVGYDGLDEVDITVSAISSTYVGSGITRRSSSDLTASGATVSVPSGYYENNASKSVASGTAGTPTASKGIVSSHSITVTPSVTNSTGYITGSTITGTGVTVSASELVSGTKSITSNATGIDVTNYAAVDVAVQGLSAYAYVIVYHSVGTTPTCTNTDGSIALSTTMVLFLVSDNAASCVATAGGVSETVAISSGESYYVNLNVLHLYTAGDTGGWATSAWKYSTSAQGLSARAPTVTYNANNMSIAITSGGAYSGMAYHDKVDLTKYSSVRLTGSFTGSSSYFGVCGLYVFTTVGSGGYDSTYSAKKTVIATGTQDLTADISALTGQYYVGIGVARNSSYQSTFTITGVWLE